MHAAALLPSVHFSEKPTLVAVTDGENATQAAESMLESTTPLEPEEEHKKLKCNLLGCKDIINTSI